MEKEINNISNKIQDLKIESDKWRSVKSDLLEFRKKQLEEKEKEFSDLKASITNYFQSDYYGGNKEIGYIDIVIDCYDSLLEKSNPELSSIYKKYCELVMKKLNKNNEKFNILIKLRNSIYKLKKLIKEEEFFYKKEIASIKELNESLSKISVKIWGLESSLTKEKKASYILNNRLIEKDQIIANLKNKLDEINAEENLRELKEINLNEELESEINNEIIEEKNEIIADLKKKLAEFESKEKANQEMNQSLSQINLDRNLEFDLESITSQSESDYSLIEEQH